MKGWGGAASLGTVLYDRPYMRERPAPAPWSATMIIIVANALVFAIQLLARLRPGSTLGWLLSHAILVPGDLARGAVWQLVTFQFMHGGLFHLGINCLMLYLFGRTVETTLGRASFWRLYLASGAVGGLLQAICSWVAPGHFGVLGTVGASCGVFGIVATFAMMNREMPITTLVAFVLPVSMKAKYLVVVSAVIAVLGMLQGGSGVAHAGHLGGLLSGVAYVHFALHSRSLNLRWPRVLRSRREPELVVMSGPARPRRQPAARTEQEDLPPQEFIEREVDPILDKISQHGLQSLTPRERRILELARERMSRK